MNNKGKIYLDGLKHDFGESIGQADELFNGSSASVQYKRSMVRCTVI